MLSWFDSHSTLFFPDDAAPDDSVVLTLFFPALPVFLTPSSLDTAAVFPRPCPVADAAALAAVLRVTLVGRATCGGLFVTFFAFVGLVSLLLVGADEDFCSLVDFLAVALVGFAAACVATTFLTFVFDVPLVVTVVVVAVVLVVALVERS